MPGTIFVSVLEFLGLPDSSSASTLSIKVSMGKKEYQTWDKGELSFPLTTFRETLHVVVQDNQGNAVSCAGIETKSIVERGVWDDIFPLEGGGQVHMKLRFVLSEDEKNRIRVLRESAVKKNRRQLLGRRTSSASSLGTYNADKNDENASTSSSFPRRAEVNTSKVNIREFDEEVQAPSLSAGTSTEVICPKDSPSSTSSLESASSLMTRKDEVNTNEANRGELDEKVQAQSLSSRAPTKAAYTKVSSSSTSNSQSEFSPTKRAPILTPSVEVNTSKVNLRESIEKVHAQSLSSGAPTEAAYTKVLSSSTSNEQLEFSPTKRAPILTPSVEVNTSKVNLRESIEKVHAQSLSSGAPTEAAYTKVSSSSTSDSQSESSPTKRAPILTPRVEVNTSKVNLRESIEKVQAQSLFAGTPTEAAYTKISSFSTISSESESSSEKRASLLTQNPEVNPSKVNLTESVEKTQAHTLSAGTPTKASYPKEASSSTSSSESIPFSKKASPLSRRTEVNTSKVKHGESMEAQSTKASFSKESSSSIRSSDSSSSKKRASLERTPSSVKKMISAFESNRSPDFRPQARLTPEKREPNRIQTELKTQASMKFKELNTTKSREQELIITPNSKNKLEKEETVKNEEKPSGDFMINLTTKASLSAEKSNKNTGISEEYSDDISVDKEIQSENFSGTPKISTSRRSSMDDQEDLHSDSEISGVWIFPDHRRRFCLTTGGKKVTDFMEGQSRVSFAIPQKDRDEVDAQNEIERTDGTFEAESLQPEIEDVDASSGLVQQVMKVAIMVGFGFLVLFTRQRNKR